jgi:transposase InsO family protein
VRTPAGARKIRERLFRRFSGIPIPAKSTIHAVPVRYGLVERRGRVRRRAQGTPLSLGQRPNELWCTDYKGEFLLGNHQDCYPLTVTDHARRFLLTWEALSSIREEYAFTAFTVFERLFKERGLPANKASKRGSLQESLATYRHPHALIIDEVGYLTYGPDAANVLFHVVNDWHLRKRPMIFTTNKPLNEWGKVLHDEDMAAAILDRVLERGRFIHLDGPSGRTRHPNLEENLPENAKRLRISGIGGSDFPEPTHITGAMA